MHRYKILDGFSIVSSGVEGQPIHKITTSASEEPSDTSLLTEKGVVNLVEQVEGEITSNAIMKDLITTEGGMIVGGENGEPRELTPNETDVEMALMSSSGEVDWKQITGIHAYDAEIEATSGSILKLKGSMGISAEAGQMINTRAKNIITSASNLISTSADSEIDRTAPYIKDTVSNYYALITGPETGLKYSGGQLGIYGSTLAITETGGISQTTSGNFQLKGLRFSAEAYASANQGTKYESDPGHAEIWSKNPVSSGKVVVACEEVFGSCSNSNGNQATVDVWSDKVVLDVIDGNGADTGVQVTSAGVFVHPTTNTGSFSVSVPSLDKPPQTLTITSGGSTFSGENFSVAASTVREGVIPNITIGTPNGTETLVASTSMVRLSSAGVQITGAENPVTIHGSASSMEISSGGIRFIAPTNVLRVYTSGMEITAGERLTSANSSAVSDVEETAPSGLDKWNGILATSYDMGALYRFGVRKGVVRSAYEADDETIPTEKAVREAIDAGGGGGNLPISSAGDMIYGNMWGEAEALPIGDLGQVLTVNSSGLPEWITPQSGGMTNPMTTSGDMIIGDVGGLPKVLHAGTSGQILGVNTDGNPEWFDLFSRSSATSGDTIGTFTTSATSNNFLNIRGKYGYNTYDANTIKYSGVMMQLNWEEFRVNTDSVILGAPFRPDHAGAFLRGVRNGNNKIILLGESGGSAGMGGNYTSAYTSVGGVALAIATDYSNGNVTLGTYNNPDRATTAIASYNINSLLSYTSYGAKVQAFFPTDPGNAPEWSGASYNSRKSYVAVHAPQASGDGLLTICSSATNKYGDTSQKCETVGFRVRAGWSAFDDKVTFNTNAYFRNGLYARKLIVGVADWSGGWGSRPSDGGIIYGFGVTSARDAITSYGKDPGRQYYTTDDNRVNVYNNVTSGWDKIAYLSDITGGMVNPMVEAGDLIVGGTSGDPEALPIGEVGQVLTVGSSGVVEWVTPNEGMENPMTSFGDLIVGGADGVPEALPVGEVGQVLTVGSSGLEWANGGGGGTNWYLGAFTSAQRPASPTEGQYGYDTTIDCVIWYIGGYWKNSAGAIV